MEDEYVTTEEMSEISDVIIETVEDQLGWAVFTEMDGEEIIFRAFFPSKQSALDYLEMVKSHPDENYRICDPDIAPAAVVRTEDGVRIVAANHSSWKKGAEAIIELADIHENYCEEFRKEAAEQ